MTTSSHIASHTVNNIHLIFFWALASSSHKYPSSYSLLYNKKTKHKTHLPPINGLLNIPANMSEIIVIFDFDKTIIDADSDNWVVDELGATDLFNQLLSTMPWNSVMVTFFIIIFISCLLISISRIKEYQLFYFYCLNS